MSFLRSFFKKNWRNLVEVLYVLFLCLLSYYAGREAVLTEVINRAGGLEEFCTNIILSHFI